jgi:hypothetical protein
MKRRSINAVAITLIFVPSSCLFAYDRSYPPGLAQKQAGPEPMLAQTATQAAATTMPRIFAGLKKYIVIFARHSPDKRFHVQHRGKDLALEVVKIHEDRLSSLGGDKYFACVDMKGSDGNIYDIDFLIVLDPGLLTVKETSVHKINSKPLYNWKEEKGVWKKVPVS